MNRLAFSLFVIVAAQGVSAISGLVLARWLTVSEYSIYTIITTVSAALTFLTKGGVTMAFNAILGRVWPDPEKVLLALNAADYQRRRSSLLVVPFVLIVACWLLHRANSSLLSIVFFVGMLLMQWRVDLRNRNAEQVLYFSNFTNHLQILDSVLAIFRLLMLVIINFIGTVSASIAFFLNTASLLFRSWPIEKWLLKVVVSGRGSRVSQSYVQEMSSTYNRQLPMEIFYVLQLQLILFLLSIYGTPADTASFGALSRIGQLMAPISVLINIYAIPRFSRVKKGVSKQLFLWTSLAAIPAALLVMISFLFPDFVLLLLGANYQNLQNELFVFALGILLSVTTNAAFQLCANRGWNKFSFLQVPVVVLWILYCFAFFDMTKFINTLWLLAFLPLGQAVSVISDVIAAQKRKEFV